MFILNLSDDSEFFNSFEDYNEFLRILESLKFRNHNVIIAQPDKEVAWEFNPVRCKALFT